MGVFVMRGGRGGGKKGERRGELRDWKREGLGLRHIFERVVGKRRRGEGGRVWKFRYALLLIHLRLGIEPYGPFHPIESAHIHALILWRM